MYKNMQFLGQSSGIVGYDFQYCGIKFSQSWIASLTAGQDNHFMSSGSRVQGTILFYGTIKYMTRNKAMSKTTNTQKSNQ